MLAVLVLGACASDETVYEKGVADYEPIYCYQTIGSVDCHRRPKPRDAARLVNHYGPPPRAYDPPDLVEEKALQAPPEATGADTAAAMPEARTAANEKPGGWTTWLPILSVVFGAFQVGAAFLF
ncbi:MAG: hypothetical protein IPK66_10350 [Rhodospirillales bacterium]|nr:hypothetical protein [Rhodospirillales bacterium]